MTSVPAPGAHVSAPAQSGAPGSRGTRAFRPRRMITSMIVALLLTAAAVLGLVEVLSALFGRPVNVLPVRQGANWLRSTPWNDPAVITTGVVLALLGLLLLALALLPGRTRMVPLVSDDPDLILGATPRSVNQMLGVAARDVSGVSSARTRVRGKKVRVDVDTSVQDTDDLRNRVTEAVEARLANLQPLQKHRVKVNIRRHGGRLR
ncbi:DUF6286 domain-containing protein [Bailinhaonella thermotolerans]|uniref:Alkaline shock response membrane anchor protein AmaP n=1 Tax=Bailinhaonella thermotolerans TaxID=1070861 RepID=A0A3A4B4E4_9ACTN|nr:DUF6286 domain-containing protein [Bailinhaonella thermotolerans]RJL33187.1 alkaline shock response membrane anchor protein AmaP [Bailinhaonella thermotolerans]